MLGLCNLFINVFLLDAVKKSKLKNFYAEEIVTVPGKWLTSAQRKMK